MFLRTCDLVADRFSDAKIRDIFVLPNIKDQFFEILCVLSLFNQLLILFLKYTEMYASVFSEFLEMGVI
jgi:hypothetical protein